MTPQRDRAELDALWGITNKTVPPAPLDAFMGEAARALSAADDPSAGGIALADLALLRALLRLRASVQALAEDPSSDVVRDIIV